MTRTKPTIPEDERRARGQTRLSARLDLDASVELAAVLRASGESPAAWVIRKIASDFARIQKKREKDLTIA